MIRFLPQHPVSDLDVVLATRYRAVISTLQGLMSGRHVLQRNGVPHVACVSCTSVVAQQCNCSIASMIVHAMRTHSVIWHVKVARPSWSRKGETPVSCDVTGLRLERFAHCPQFPKEAGHESSSSHSGTPSLGTRHRPQMSAWLFMGSLSPLPHKHDKET